MKVIKSIEVKVKYTETDEMVPGRAEDKVQMIHWDSQGSLVISEDNGLSLIVNLTSKEKTVPLINLGPLLLI
jgi:hypothetical protein